MCLVNNGLFLNVSAFVLSDCELWSDKELSRPGGYVHHSDDHTVPHRGEEGHYRTVQLRPRDDPRSQVTEALVLSMKSAFSGVFKCWFVLN